MTLTKAELADLLFEQLGNFQLREKPQRPGRNPKTGEEIPITARRVVTFHASQKLKAMVEVANHAGPQPS
jgi:integration host factor subunit alpha